MSTLVLLGLLSLSADPPSEAASAAAVRAQADADQPERPGPFSPVESHLAHPLYLDEEPPSVRACRLILLNFAGAASASATVARTKEQAIELGEKVVAQIRDGADPAEFARRLSSSATAWSGGVYGTFTPRVLAPPLDEFLFSAELGEVSDPIVLASGVHILQRIEHEAASRQIMIAKTEPDARERVLELKRRVEAGEDFAELARAHSMDERSAARGGILGLVQRTREDRLLRAATFEPPVGGLVGPIETHLGYHLVQRIPLDLVPPDARETRFIRASAILVRFEGARPFDLADVRSPSQAEAIVREAYQRALAGEDFAELARRWTEDLGGRERGGDLGWLHRHSYTVPEFMEPAFWLEPGEMLEPVFTTAGWLLVRRDR